MGNALLFLGVRHRTNRGAFGFPSYCETPKQWALPAADQHANEEAQDHQHQDRADDPRSHARPAFGLCWARA
jgi:hypothetical protein